MIIDGHVHLVGEGWVHDDFMKNLARLVATGLEKDTEEYPDPLNLVDGIKDALFDTTGEKLVREMDASGIDQACVFVVDYGLWTGEPAVPIEEQNRLIGEAVKRFPDRLIGFFSVDPRRPNALELFQRGVEDWGLRGLKLHPSSGWYPYDEVAFPLYEQCAAYKFPLIIHTGGQPAPMRSRFGRPVYVDDVAAQFPTLPIIMAHCGFGWWEEALMVCNIKANCHVDISGWQQAYARNPEYFYGVFRQILDTLGPWRVIFGTDGPYLNGICPPGDWVEAIRNPQLPEGDVSFTKEELDRVMGQSFNRLLKGLTYER